MLNQPGPVTKECLEDGRDNAKYLWLQEREETINTYLVPKLLPVLTTALGGVYGQG